MNNLKSTGFGLALIPFVAAGAIYKWIDQDGQTHYSDKPQSEITTETIEISPSPPWTTPELPREQPGASKPSEPSSRHQRAPAARSLPLGALGGLPKNLSSQFLETVSTGVAFNFENRTATYSISLKAKPSLPFGAYLELHFENPGEPDRHLIVGENWRGGPDDIFVISPEFRGIRCWNYEVTVYIYPDESKSHRLGVHRQTIQSRVNLDRVESLGDLLDAMRYGRCP